MIHRSLTPDRTAAPTLLTILTFADCAKDRRRASTVLRRLLNDS